MWFRKHPIHSVFEIVDVLRRVVILDVSGQVTCFFAKMMYNSDKKKFSVIIALHSFFNVEILHVELPLVENLHVALQRCFILILIIELIHLNDVLLDDVVFLFNLCLRIELLFDELERILINKVLYLVMIKSTNCCLFA